MNMKTAYAILIDGYVEDIILTENYDEAEQFAKETWWDGKEPKFNGDFQTIRDEEIKIHLAELHEVSDG